MADTLENMQEAHIRRSEKTESRSIEETNVNKKLDKNLLSVNQTCPDYVLNCDSQGRALGSMVKIMNKNVSVGYYDKTESILISQKKGDEDERQNSTETRPEKRVTKQNAFFVYWRLYSVYLYGCAFSGKNGSRFKRKNRRFKEECGK